MEITSRQAKILAAIIEQYAEIAVPVGSVTLAKLFGVSSATIRSEMARLEDMGLIEAPHTSAGRIPTDKGYRLYILSNYGAWTYAKTKDQSLGFLKDVDGALFSFEVKQIKPEPEIYHSLLERFHLRAEECVFLDDRQNNVDGAIACGISAIRFTGYEDARQKLKEYGVEC